MTELERAFHHLGGKFDARPENRAVMRAAIRKLAQTTIQRACSDVDAARERNRKLKAKIAEDAAA